MRLPVYRTHEPNKNLIREFPEPVPQAVEQLALF